METIKVRIKKCESRVFWYHDLVGKEFIVIAENQIGYEAENNILNGHTIRKEECEVIETSKEDKEIIGYKCPMDLFAGAIRIGAIFKRLDFDDTLYNSPDLRNVWHHLPKEIVETWKPIYKDKEKTQRELDNEEILRIEVEIMKSDKTISEYLIEGSYYIGKRTKK